MLLRIRSLRVDKGGKTICSVPELDIQQGERVAVVGPNGSGKTTLLKVISGLEREFCGECRSSVSMRERVYVHQSPYLIRGSVLFNVRYGLAARKVSTEQQMSTAMKWLNKFGIGHLSKRRCEGLSGGERRRVALARAFAIQPKVLLLDEPLADLDKQGIDIVGQVIEAESHSTIVIASPVPLELRFPVPSYNLQART